MCAHAQLAFLMAASCTLQAHAAREQHAPSLSLARHMLDQARAAAEALRQLPQPASTSAAAQADDAFRQHMLKLVRCLTSSRAPCYIWPLQTQLIPTHVPSAKTPVCMH